MSIVNVQPRALADRLHANIQHPAAAMVATLVAAVGTVWLAVDERRLRALEASRALSPSEYWQVYQDVMDDLGGLSDAPRED